MLAYGPPPKRPLAFEWPRRSLVDYRNLLQKKSIPKWKDDEKEQWPLLAQSPSTKVDWAMAVPQDVLALIFGNLNVRDIPKVATMCRSWYKATRSNAMWGVIAQRFVSVGAESLAPWTTTMTASCWRDCLR